MTDDELARVRKRLPCKSFNYGNGSCVRGEACWCVYIICIRNRMQRRVTRGLVCFSGTVMRSLAAQSFTRPSRLRLLQSSTSY